MDTTQQPEALAELRERLRSFEADHTPDGWPAVRMRDITALLDDLDNARSDNQVLRLGYAAARLEIESLQSLQKKEPPMTTTHTSGAAELLVLIDAYAEARHVQGHRSYNDHTKAARKAVVAALASTPAQAAEPSITLDFKMATDLLGMFCGEPGLVTLQRGDEHCHSGPGLYAWYSDMPEEGAGFLGAEPDDEATPSAPSATAQPVAEASRFGSPELQAMIIARCVEKDQADSGFDYKTAADFLSGKKVSDEALRKFVAASRCAHDARAALHAKMLSLQGELASREAEIALLKRSLLDAEAAPHPPTAQAAQADNVQEEAARLDFLIDQGAYVVSDPDACPGYWLHWARPDGDTWVQIDKYPTPRAAIDAARKQEEKQ